MTTDQNRQEEYEIDLLKLGKSLWHYAWLLVAAMVVCGALAFVCARFMITPLYEASSMLYVNNSSVSLGSTKVSITSGDLSAQSGLIDTYSVILTSRNTLEAVIDKTELPYSYEQLKPMISAGSVNNTGVLRITATNDDPAVAAVIANALTDVLSERIVSIVEGSSVEVVDYAVVPTTAASPNVMRYTLIGILLGLVLSAAFVVLRTLMDSTIRGEDFLLENYKDIPVLTMVPDLNSDKQGGYYYGGQSKRKGKEAAV